MATNLPIPKNKTGGAVNLPIYYNQLYRSRRIKTEVVLLTGCSREDIGGPLFVTFRSKKSLVVNSGNRFTTTQHVESIFKWPVNNFLAIFEVAFVSFLPSGEPCMTWWSYENEKKDHSVMKSKTAAVDLTTTPPPLEVDPTLQTSSSSSAPPTAVAADKPVLPSHAPKPDQVRTANDWGWPPYVPPPNQVRTANSFGLSK